MTLEVQKLKNLAAYQQGSIVSRTVLKKEAGTVTVFAFTAGEGLSEHKAPYEALLCGIEGEAEVTVSGSSFRLQEGEAVTLPANEPHALRAVSDFKMLLIMVKSSV